MSLWGSIKKGLETGLGALGGGAIGGVASAYSANLSAKEAQKNRQFQERMSSTAYQRAAADLEAAGLNRILALGSPASTPGGAMGQVPDFGSAITAGANAGIAGVSSAYGLSKTEAETAKILTENQISEELLTREIMKTDAWKKLGPEVLEAIDLGVDAWNYVTDPENLQRWYDAFRQESKKALEDFKRLVNAVSEKFGLNETDRPGPDRNTGVRNSAGNTRGPYR